VRLETTAEDGGSGRNGCVEARSSVGEAWLALTSAGLPNQI
jgi:hypothetical protein